MKLSDSAAVTRLVGMLKERHEERELMKSGVVARLTILNGSYKSTDYQFENDQSFAELKEFALKTNKMKIMVIKAELANLGVDVDDTEDETEDGAEERS